MEEENGFGWKFVIEMSWIVNYIIAFIKINMIQLEPSLPPKFMADTLCVCERYVRMWRKILRGTFLNWQICSEGAMNREKFFFHLLLIQSNWKVVIAVTPVELKDSNIQIANFPTHSPESDLIIKKNEV